MGPPISFYSAAATIIPVLVIAALVEMRRLSDRVLKPSREMLWSGLVVVLAFATTAILGEIAALTALLEGPGKGSANTVGSTLVCMAFLLLFGPVFTLLRALEAQGVRHVFTVGLVGLSVANIVGVLAIAL